jgi:hypothetical protein
VIYIPFKSRTGYLACSVEAAPPVRFLKSGTVCDRVNPFGFFINDTREGLSTLCLVYRGFFGSLIFFPKRDFRGFSLYIINLAGSNYTEKGGGGGVAPRFAR